MDIVHFTENATDPLEAFGAGRASFVPLADGEGDTHVSCLHLQPGGTITAPSIDHAATLLVVHGRINMSSREGQALNLTIHAGMGCVTRAQEPYAFSSDMGAIVLIVESTTLKPHPQGISSPQRIAGATWPSDVLLDSEKPT